jgi:hypothetical protein
MEWRINASRRITVSRDGLPSDEEGKGELSLHDSKSTSVKYFDTMPMPSIGESSRSSPRHGLRRRRRHLIGRPLAIASFTMMCSALVFQWNTTTPTMTMTMTEHQLEPTRTTSQSRPLGQALEPAGAVDFNVKIACDQHDLVGEDVFRSWKFIDETLAEHYNQDRVSGGIFLYPRQASLLTALIGKISDALDHREVTICETGFGSGHSLALFLNAVAHKNKLVVVSFDKFDRPYQLPLWHHFNETYSQEDQDHRLVYVAGDSCKTVPDHLFRETNHVPEGKFQCDILHGSSLCGTDNIDLVEHSPCGVLLTTTAMGDLRDRTVYFGPRAQWRQLRERGCITDPVCFEEDVLKVQRDFVFAKQGSAHTSQFCIAMTTGKCGRDGGSSSKASCTTDIYQVVSELRLDKLCPHYQVDAPA